MQALIQRSQTDYLSGVVFSLWVKFKLQPEEEKLLDQYKMRRVVIRQSAFMADMKKAALYSGLFLLLFAIGFTVFQYFRMGAASLLFFLDLLVILVIAPFPLLTIFLYYRIRERLSLKDMLAGRSFSCRNIHVLLEREKFLTQTAENTRSFLHLMQTWDKQVVMMIEDQGRPATVVEMPRAAE